MKYCVKCGSELRDEAVMCPNCGNMAEKRIMPQYKNTKYCEYCGAEVLKEAVICPKCGCLIKHNSNNTVDIVSNSLGRQNEMTSMQKAVKIFMTIGCVCFILFWPGLLWSIPMRNKYIKAIENSEPLSIGFKICTLLFVNAIAGILMLCDNNNA